jgi:hypothetical protein
MRKELGVLLMEDESGEINVQLFAEIQGVEKAFGNLVGSPADPPRRATLVSIRYGEDGEAHIASLTKLLPILESIENRPDGYVLGGGPINFPKI